MNLKKLLLTNNDCYKAGKYIIPKGIMVHSTGANNPYLKRYINPDDGLLGLNQNFNDWNRPKPDGQQKCVHAFIGKLNDGSIATYQTLPWNMRGWHAGGNANDTYIGFEICEDGLTDIVYLASVLQEAVELCAYLCKLYNLNPLQDGVIIDHSEGYKRGIASNHGDIKHWFSKHDTTMDFFRQKINSELLILNKKEELTMEQYEELSKRIETLENEMVYNYVDNNMPEWAKPTINLMMNKGYLRGNEKGELNLTYDMLRVFVTLDRAGVYGN